MIILNETQIKDLNLTLVEDNGLYVVIEDSNSNHQEHEFTSLKQAVKCFEKLSKWKRKDKTKKHHGESKSGF